MRGMMHGERHYMYTTHYYVQYSHMSSSELGPVGLCLCVFACF